MAKCKIKAVKKAGLKKGAAGAKALADGSLLLLDNEDSSCTVMGVDAQGFPVSLADVATVTATSSNAAVASVGTPSGVTYTLSALTPGDATIAVTATWNDNSIGPFSFDDPITVSHLTGPATGLKIDHSPPVPR